MESVGGYAYFVSEGTLSADPKFLFFFCCGGLTRTDDLWVMSPTSYQLLHSAMLCFDYGCKGTAFFLISKLFLHLFLK